MRIIAQKRMEARIAPLRGLDCQSTLQEIYGAVQIGIVDHTLKIGEIYSLAIQESACTKTKTSSSDLKTFSFFSSFSPSFSPFSSSCCYDQFE